MPFCLCPFTILTLFPYIQLQLTSHSVKNHSKVDDMKNTPNQYAIKEELIHVMERIHFSLGYISRANF